MSDVSKSLAEKLGLQYIESLGDVSPPQDLAGSGEKLINGKLYQDSLLVSMGERHLFVLNLENANCERLG